MIPDDEIMTHKHIAVQF
ncbi:hypothetical protein [Yersinia alsatica]|nr:hypothetical protein [Yersinia alsatica]